MKTHFDDDMVAWRREGHKFLNGIMDGESQNIEQYYMKIIRKRALGHKYRILMKIFSRQTFKIIKEGRETTEDCAILFFSPSLHPKNPLVDIHQLLNVYLVFDFFLYYHPILTSFSLNFLSFFYVKINKKKQNYK